MTTIDSVYAEDVNYWQTSQRSADNWMDDAKKEITAIGGKIITIAFIDTDGKSAFMLEFLIAGEVYKALWRVLPSKTGKDQAAKKQAATALYHDIKSKCVAAKWQGIRTAFFSFLVLPDGRTASQVATPEIAAFVPSVLLLPSPKQLPRGFE